MDHPGRGFAVDPHRLVQVSITDQSPQLPFAVAGPDGLDKFIELLGKVDLRTCAIQAEIGERIVDIVDVEPSRAEAGGVSIVAEAARVFGDRLSVVGSSRVGGCRDQLVAVDTAAVLCGSRAPAGGADR